MKKIEKIAFEELVEWAEGHIIKELIKGNFHNGVLEVCNIAKDWNNSRLPKKSKIKPSKDSLYFRDNFDEYTGEKETTNHVVPISKQKLSKKFKGYANINDVPKF